MGLLTWIGTTGRKSQAAALIQQFFEVSQRHGMFPGDPAWAANKLTELACNRVPALPEKWKGFVLASAVLAVVVMEEDLDMEDRDRSAMALAGMLKAASTERHLHSYEEQALLDTGRRVYEKFRGAFPSPLMAAPMDTSAPTTPEPAESTGKERARAMDELIRRMSA